MKTKSNRLYDQTALSDIYLIYQITILTQMSFDGFCSRRKWMGSLKGFKEEIHFKEKLTKGMDGGEKFIRSENEIASRGGT